MFVLRAFQKFCVDVIDALNILEKTNYDSTEPTKNVVCI